MSPRVTILAALIVALLAAWEAVMWWPEAAQKPEERLPIPPLPPRLEASDQYETCLAMVPADPMGAASMAEAMLAGGAGAPAVHCRGLAMLALGEAAEGAATLEAAAGDTDAPSGARAAVYGQAAQAWMIAGDPAQARRASDAALALAPDDPDLLVDRAAASAALGDQAAAAADLDHTLTLDPQRTDALTLRGAARRQLGDLAGAQDDVDRALAQDPDNPEALLERGILRQRRNDRPGARQDWERAIALAPDSQAADLAQQNLALLEAGPSR